MNMKKIILISLLLLIPIGAFAADDSLIQIKIELLKQQIELLKQLIAILQSRQVSLSPSPTPIPAPVSTSTPISTTTPVLTQNQGDYYFFAELPENFSEKDPCFAIRIKRNDDISVAGKEVKIINEINKTSKTYTFSRFGTISYCDSPPPLKITITDGVKSYSLAYPPVKISYSFNGIVYTLSWWSSKDITSCYASGDWSGQKPSNGQEVIGEATTTKTYIISCIGANKETISDKVVIPPSSEVSIVSNNSNIISWTSKNVQNCVASGSWSGNKLSSGQEFIGPSSLERVFIISCLTPHGETVSDKIIIPPTPTPTPTPTPCRYDYDSKTKKTIPVYDCSCSWGICG